MAQPVSSLISRLADINRGFMAVEQAYSQRVIGPDVCDFVFGNPHEMPLPGITNLFQRWSVPQNQEWFAYKLNVDTAQAAVAEALQERHGLAFEPEDITMTTGAFSALLLTLRTIVDPGDEVIMIVPPWFFYESLIVAAGGVCVRVNMRPDNFDLDLDAIEAAITPRTRAIIINSPNNPTGKIYPPETLAALGDLLERASRRIGRTIYLMSDEAYSRILFDGRSFPSPARYYAASFVIYTYGKTLLMPGQRIGYIAVAPSMPERETFRQAFLLAQIGAGYAFPNALLQYSLPELERMTIDIGAMQRRRDRLVDALRQSGYEVHVPEGTFYLLPKSPLSDDTAFADLLAEHDVFVLPGSVAEVPGYFRISLTANDDMVERSLPRFAAAMDKAKQRLAVS